MIIDDTWAGVPDCFEHGPTMYRLIIKAELPRIGLIDGGDDDLFEITFFLCPDCARLMETALQSGGIAPTYYRIEEAVLETIS